MSNTTDRPAISNVQRLIFEILRGQRWNEFDGGRIVGDLEHHPDLWLALYPSRHEAELGVVLRDLPGNFLNADTICVTARAGQEKELERLAKRWKPDTVRWVEESEFGVGRRPGGRVLSLWWD